MPDRDALAPMQMNEMIQLQNQMAQLDMAGGYGGMGGGYPQPQPFAPGAMGMSPMLQGESRSGGSHAAAMHMSGLLLAHPPPLVAHIELWPQEGSLGRGRTRLHPSRRRW